MTSQKLGRGEKNNNIIISLYFACSDRNAALGSAAEDDWLFHIEWIQQKLGVLPIWVIHRVEIILKRCSWFQQLCNCQTCSWRQLWEINFPEMVEWMSICFGRLRSPWLYNIAKSAWYRWKEISGEFWLIYNKIRASIIWLIWRDKLRTAWYHPLSWKKGEWQNQAAQRRTHKPRTCLRYGSNCSSYTFIQKNWKPLQGLNNTCMQTEKWDKHTLKLREQRSTCIQRQQSRTYDITQRKNTKTERPALQQGCCFVTNRRVKKHRQPRETLFVITQPQLQINWPITVSRPTDESEKQWLLRDSQRDLFPSDDDLSKVLASQPFENMPTYSN